MIQPHDYQPPGRISTCSCSSHVSKVPAVPMERSALRTLAFGLSLSPLVFTKILRPVLRWARRKGIRISAYLDELIIVAKTKEMATHQTSLILNKFKSRGFLYKESKSHLTPSQTIDHLGFSVNTTNMSLSVPASKRRDIRRKALRMLRDKSCSLRHLSSFIGKAQATTPAVFLARLQTRELLQLKNQLLQQGTPPWTATIHLTPPACSNLHWWINHLSKWNGLSFLPGTSTQEIFTDATDNGWEIVINNKVWSGEWIPEERLQHINYKEMCADETPPGTSASNLLCDNTSAIANVRHFGGTAFTSLNGSCA